MFSIYWFKKSQRKSKDRHSKRSQRKPKEAKGSQRKPKEAKGQALLKKI
jgi:hypothetical protein